jgi:hypothetical protein
MLSSSECLAKAAEMDDLALISSNPANSEAFTIMAKCWRRNAVIARQQDAWTERHPTE